MQLQNLTDSERVYKVKYNEEVTLYLKHVSREELRTLNKKAKTVRFENHQKIEDYDAGKADSLLGCAAIKGWEGVMFGDDPAKCTPENITLLMTRHNVFSKFINDICDDIDALIREEKEAERKNS